jgi:methyl-accepting chemotaxis protein
MLKRLSLLALLAGASACLPATERDFQMAQTINEMSDAVNEIRQVSYELQDRVDSLVFVIDKRDTVIRQLANLAGVTVPP